MVTVDKEIVTKEGFTTTNQTFYGLSTDSKPTSGGNGSCFIEIDTGKAYFFDAEGGEWVEVQSSGGGGGSSSQAVMMCEITDPWTFELSKTWKEIDTAMRSGILCYAESVTENDYARYEIYETKFDSGVGIYYVEMYSFSSGMQYELETASENGYPAMA